VRKCYFLILFFSTTFFFGCFHWLLICLIFSQPILGRDTSPIAGGDNTVAIGNKASTGIGSKETTAVGPYSAAIGDFSQAFGYKVGANGESSTAIGSDSQANGLSSTAIGSNNNLASDYGLALGYKNVLSGGERSVAVGSENTTTVENAYAFGDGNKISSIKGSIALGAGNVISGGQRGIALGQDNTVTGNQVIAIGTGITATQNNTIILGAEVGTGASNVGVGTSTPTDKLDVNGTARVRTLGASAGTDNLVVADATTGQLHKSTITASALSGADLTNDAFINNTASTRVELGTTSTGAARPAGTEFVVTDAGRVGIGTIAPTYPLEVIGNIKATRFIGFGAGNIGTNSAVGANSLASNTTGSENTADGVNALNATTTGSRNTAIGRSVLQANTTGNGNTGVGQQTLTAATAKW